MDDVVEAELLTRIPAAVAACGFAEPAYCLVLVYGYDPSMALPPTLAVGLESERRHWICTSPGNCREFMWNPAEFSQYGSAGLSLLSEDSRPLYDRYNAWLREQGRNASVRDLLVGVARKLQRRDWHEIMRVTDDFVVYAVDDEEVDLSNNIVESVPPSLVRRFQTENWL